MGDVFSSGVASMAAGGVVAAARGAGVARIALGTQTVAAAAGAAVGYTATNGSCDKPGSKNNLSC